MSATSAARTNGLCENLVKRVSEGIKLYAKNDLEIEDIIPLIAMGLRASVHTRTCISPYEAAFGQVMPVGHVMASKPNDRFQGTAKEYRDFIQHRLHDIHKGMADNIVDAKADDKREYDKRNKVVKPQWGIGQQVLLEDKRPQTQRHRIVSHRPFDYGPYFISDIVQGDGIGPAYRLVNVDTGKPYARLVSGDRLKLYCNDRTDFEARCPKLITPRADSSKTQSTSTPTSDKKQQQRQTMDEAIKVLRQSGPHMFYVLYADQSKSWSDNISPLLLKEWRLAQDQARLRRRQNRSKQ